MATIRLIPSAYTVSSTTRVTVTNPTYAYDNTDDTSDYAQFRGRNSSSNTYYAFLHGFNFDDVPSNATVTGFRVLIRCYRNSYQQTGSTYRLRLASQANNSYVISNTTTSTDIGTTASVIEIPIGNLDWDDVANYGSNFSIEMVLRPSSSQYPYIYVYGAEIEVTYTVPVPRTITSSIIGEGSISPSGATTVYDGDSYTLTISGTNSPTVTDNNVDVTSQLVQSSNGTKTLIPYDYTNSSFTLTNITNAYNDSSNTTYADLTLAGRTTGTLYLDLGGAAIPSGATVQSVSCSATLQFSRNGSSSSVTSSFQLYSGSTAKGSATNWVTSATDIAKTTYTLTTGTWTASEIANARFYITSYNGASSTQRHIYIYGVSFNVTYEFDGVVYTYTISNISSDHTIIVTSASQSVDVTGVDLNKSSDSIQEGQTLQLIATVSPNDATNKSVTWSSNNTSVATVLNGLVTAVSEGTATITVTTVDGGFTDTCVITVTPEPRITYVQANSLVPGNTYLVVNGNTGSVYAMTNEAGSTRQLKGLSVTITNGSISLKESDSEKCAFECIQYTSGNSITTTLQSDGKYLYCDNSSGLRFQTSSSLDRFWHFNNNKFWQFKSSSSDGYSDSSSEYKYYLTVSNGYFTDNHVDTTSIENSDIPAIYLFMPASQVTNEMYYKVNGNWVSVSEVYKKINGNWVLQTDLTSVFDSNVNYKLSQ